MKHVLIVGAGAVGQIYGHALACAGDRVTFLTKPKYLADAEGGFHLRYLKMVVSARDAQFTDFEVTTETDGAKDVDEIWLCVSSTALNVGTWLRDLRANYPTAVIVAMTPGAHQIDALAGAEVVGGMIGIISFQRPEPEPPGISVWFPPGSPSKFNGGNDIVERLTRGGCPAKRDDHATDDSAQASGVLMPFIVALECADWSLKKLRKDRELMALFKSAAADAVEGAAADSGRATIGVIRGLRPPFSALLGPTLCVMPSVAPFDLEWYLEYHFMKVRDQTIEMMGLFIDMASSSHGRIDALTALLNRVQSDG